MKMTEQEDGGRSLKDELRSIREMLERLDTAIRGNGQPGIKARLGRLESKDRVRSRLLWTVAGAVIVIAVGTVWQMVTGVR